MASFHSEHTLRIFDYPALTIQENPAAHVGGCIAIAQDPRGKYIASGGHDSIVNLFDVTEWICARTITCCEWVLYQYDPIRVVSHFEQSCDQWTELLLRRRVFGYFQHEHVYRHSESPLGRRYLYPADLISKCAAETGMPIHRVPTAGPVSTVTWHPSKHLIAFCGQTKVREGAQTPPTALVSLFGAN